jgi:hypothetical protein
VVLGVALTVFLLLQVVTWYWLLSKRANPSYVKRVSLPKRKKHVVRHFFRIFLTLTLTLLFLFLFSDASRRYPAKEDVPAERWYISLFRGQCWSHRKQQGNLTLYVSKSSWKKKKFVTSLETCGMFFLVRVCNCQKATTAQGLQLAYQSIDLLVFVPVSFFIFAMKNCKTAIIVPLCKYWFSPFSRVRWRALLSRVPCRRSVPNCGQESHQTLEASPKPFWLPLDLFKSGGGGCG